MDKAESIGCIATDAIDQTPTGTDFGLVAADKTSHSSTEVFGYNPEPIAQKASEDDKNRKILETTFACIETIVAAGVQAVQTFPTKDFYVVCPPE